MAQVLHIANGDTVNQKLTAPGNLISKWVDRKVPPDQIVDEAYLASLSRLPSRKEKEQLTAALSGASITEQRQVMEDICWAILSSKEFLFNH